MGLERYRRKRNFHSTPEPSGKVQRSVKEPSFVVQKHAARRLHYDFRLQIGGVLASWAIPKGPSLDPGKRRLAVHVEDHPLEYGKFEGVIPKGHYGAGDVKIWDRGVWMPQGNPRTGLRQGKLKFLLRGKKLSGGWSLIRMRGRNNQPGKDNWLLIKERDDAAASDFDGVDRDGKKSQRTHHRRARALQRNARPKAALARHTKKQALPGFVRPQLATLVDAVPRGNDWLHEVKFDGYRILCRVKNRRAVFLTREGKDWSHRFSFLTAAALTLPAREVLLDGEVVALREDGSTDFQLLQNSLKEATGADLVYFVFDLLHLDGRNLIDAPLFLRKEKLQELFKGGRRSANRDLIRYSEHWIEGDALFEEACARSLEGIVSKRNDQPYRSGRSRDWLKIKCVHSQEFVIIGFTDPAGSRTGFGALLLGVYDDDETLRYAGRVGTGFTRRTLDELRSRLDKLRQARSPLSEPLTGMSAQGVHWVKPELVGEVAFTGWTEDGLLRHPSFEGLREDKPARQIRRERTQSMEKTAGPMSLSARGSGRKSEEQSTEIAGVKLSHPNRVLYPEQGITKRELAEYYAQIADWILPHVSGRPLTLVRCPEGQQGQCFYQRNADDGISSAIHRLPLRDGKSVKNGLVIDSLGGLIALVQMGVLEIHAWGSTAKRIERPDRLTFDLDPAPGLPWKIVREATFELRDLLMDLGLGAFVKTTGGKGLHVVVPITPTLDWKRTKVFAKAVAESMVAAKPELYVATMSKAKRADKIFIDYLRNARSATAICAYSTRARAGAPVAMPLRWDELKADLREDHFNIRNVPARLRKLLKDPWDGYEAARRSITAATRKRLGLK
jgi:bifunctional non-homologous end joining protein LigD